LHVIEEIWFDIHGLYDLLVRHKPSEQSEPIRDDMGSKRNGKRPNGAGDSAQDGRVLSIGQLARTVNLSRRTIRYYEELGILPEPTAHRPARGSTPRNTGSISRVPCR
jgi:MerR family regulatory protein